VSDLPSDPRAAGIPAADVQLDIRHEVCPYTFLEAKLALEPLATGRILRVVVGNETSARDVPRSLADAGHAILAVEPVGPGLWCVTVRKGSPRRPA
jgi:tRNA 2-thiouridine synthesizing protein A